MVALYKMALFIIIVTSKPVEWDIFHVVNVASEIPVEETLKVIAIESSFKPHAISSAGAVGLMQITPIALREVQERVGSGQLQGCMDTLGYSFTDMQIPFHNVRVGTCFIKYLKTVYPKMLTVLIHYNGGGAAVRAFNKGKHWPASLDYLHKWDMYSTIINNWK